MNYAIAAYAVTIGILVLYGVQMARERRRLQRALASAPDPAQD